MLRADEKLIAFVELEVVTRKLTLNEAPTVTVIGKAFWDIGHAPKDQSNRRKRLPQYAVWEIHPVMALHVVQ
jgi:hypothetical protein